MIFSSSPQYPAIITYENYTFNFVPTDWLEDGKDIYDFLTDLFEGLDLLLETLETTEPKTHAIVMESLTGKHINFYFMNADVSVSHATGDRCIYFNNKVATYHELVHVFLTGKLGELHWLAEGITTLLTLPIESVYSGDDNVRFFIGKQTFSETFQGEYEEVFSKFLLDITD